MAKRFTCTEKWKKHFIRGLQAPYKLLWIYILDECSAAGIWEVDLDVAQIKLGVKLKKETAEKVFKDKVFQIDNGTKWFIPAFVEFQYGQLMENNRAHTATIATLKKFNLIDEYLKVKPLSKPLTAPLQGDKDMVMDKDKVKVKETDMDKGDGTQKIIFPFETENFIRWWKIWIEYKSKQHNFKYKTPITEQAALNDLAKISDGTEENMIELIEYAISKNWEGIYPKRNQSGKQTTTNREQYNIDMAAKLEARYSGS